MKRLIIELNFFSKELDTLIYQRRLLYKDFNELEKQLIENPDLGDLIPGTGGIRKIRLKSDSKGKSGGFRICYLDDPLSGILFFILIYAKNEKEDLNSKEKNVLRELTTKLKARTI